MAAPLFDAQISPHGTPNLSLVQDGHKLIHNPHEVLEGLELDSPDLSLADTPQVEVTQSFDRDLGWPRDLRGARDDPVPDRS